MNRTRVKLNRRGIGQILKSPKVVAELEKHAAAIQQRAGSHFETKPAEIGRNRSRVAVVTSGYKGMLEEAQHRSLTRAVK